MPNDFKVVIAGLFELARDKNTPSPPSPCAADAESSPDKAVGLEEEGEPTGDKVEGTPDSGGEKEETEAAAQEVPTEETTTATVIGEDNGGQSNDSTVLEEKEGPTSNAVEQEAPEWLTDAKTFVSWFLQWADEGSAKRSKVVRARIPTRVFPL